MMHPNMTPVDGTEIAYPHLTHEDGCDASSLSELTDDEKIDIAAAQVLRRYKPAFEELAK